jgi:hypothetical protein
LTITLVDPFGNTETGFSGPKTLTFSGLSPSPDGTLPTVTDMNGKAVNEGTAETLSFTNGVSAAGGVLVATDAQTATLAVSDSNQLSSTSSGGAGLSLSVQPANATRFAVSASSSAEAGSAVTVTVTARDQFGNTAIGYSGTVKFSSSDTKAVLPSSYPFAAGDKGVHSFSVIFQQAGTQTVTIKDMVTATITGSTPAVSVSAGKPVQSGQAASIHFWANKSGQALLKSFGTTAQSQTLGQWLAATCPNMWGNLGNDTNGQVAAFYLGLFTNSATKLDAEVLATALNVFATTSSLGGTAATKYGFTVTAAGLGVATANVGSDGAAFGVPNNTTLTVMQILLQANTQAVSGILYKANTSLRPLALVVFDGINVAGGI